MNKWQAELFDALRDMPTPEQVASRIAWATTELGFDHYTYGLWAMLPLSNPTLDCIGNTPQGWQTRYRQARYAARDPVVTHARRSLEPLVWTADLLDGDPELQADASRFGIGSGWTRASVNAQGRRGLLTLTRSGAPLSASALQQKSSDLQWLAYMAHFFLSDTLMRRHEPTACAELTQREAEVLRWTGDGKTTGEISSILSISDNTVNYYLKNAMAKLHAANKTSAVVIALTQGLLTY